MRRKLIILLLVIQALLLGSCEKEPATSYITGNAKNFTNMGVGSVFVYKDSVTNEIDTLVVMKNTTSMSISELYHNGDFEYNKIHLENSHQPSDSSYFEIYYYTVGKGNIIYLDALPIYNSDSSSSFGIHGVRLYEDEFVQRNFLSDYANYPIQILDNFNLNGNQYNLVYVNELRYMDTSNHDFCLTYFSPLSCLLKFRLKKGTSFAIKELIYYKLI